VRDHLGVINGREYGHDQYGSCGCGNDPPVPAIIIVIRIAHARIGHVHAHQGVRVTTNAT